MADTDHASRVHHEAFRDYVTGRVCELISRAAELLKVPAPNTFIGRKTQEPFPQGAGATTNWSAPPPAA
ncbi:hypothetical protein XH93_12165 [Bradyrhizobium sp. CCBAU 51753]|nr:hypothetical protein XH93_12165 [Bradyrhizobium sp. CCBAU 51753]